MPKHWFGVIFTFTCPSCKRVTKDRAVAAAESPNPDDLDVSRQRPTCQLCMKKVSGKGQLKIDVEIVPSTIQQLKALGFPAPGNIPENN